METIRLKNNNGAEMLVTNLGATIMALKIPDRNGNLINVVVGLSRPQDYQSKPYTDNYLFLGCVVGRYAGRISNGQFKLNGKTYSLHKEDGLHLHGGREGFDKKIWTISDVIEGDEPSISFSYTSAHMEEGYPGNLRVKVKYSLTKNNSLLITHQAVTDRDTIINLTNHSYFNLNGEGTILDHQVSINAKSYQEVYGNLLPTGKLLNVDSTKYDYQKKQLVGSAGFTGLDNTFILNDSEFKAILESTKTGIRMVVQTNQPGMVVYTPPKFEVLPFMNNAKYLDYPAICFEAQNLPDAPNHSKFPSAVLKPNNIYLNEAKFEFSNF